MRKIEKIDDILESITEIVFPFVVIFGIYVVLNGHLSPGGGFSGGAILSAGLILYDVVFNQDNAPILPMKTYGIITSSALLVYGTLKGYSFTMGTAHKPSARAARLLGPDDPSEPDRRWCWSQRPSTGAPCCLRVYRT